MKKKLPIIIAAVVVVAAVVVAVVLLTSQGAYTKYANAFEKTLGVGSIEFNTKMTAEMEGAETVTGTGNMKLRGITGNVNFINTLTANGQTFDQFSDGTYVYMDNDGAKRKYKIGETPAAEENAPEKTGFSMDAYIEEFVGLLDASKLKQTGLLDQIEQRYVDEITQQGDTYILKLPLSLAQTLVKTMFNQETGKGTNPQVALNDMQYSATLANGYLSTLVCVAKADVTFPASLTQGAEETKAVTVTLELTFVNPGKAVTFSLPDTAGYDI